jgi:hypothetical protein
VTARVPGTRTVLGRVEDLDLGETFDVVVLLQREGTQWHREVPRRRPPAPDGEMHVVSSDEVSPGVHSVHVEYVFPDATWTQTFLSRPLGEAAPDAALAAAGLRAGGYLTDDRTWVRAVPAGPPPG